MPELPEVTNVINSLKGFVIDKTIDDVKIYYPRCVLSSRDNYVKKLRGIKILDITRKGKYIIFILENDERLLFHLRMEGKLFIIDEKEFTTKHLSILFTFKDSDEMLAFYDTRKFGISYLFKQGEESPLDRVGKEPFDLTADEFYEKVKSDRRPIKEILLDQSVIAGIGNIYADEISYACYLSPFKRGIDLSIDDCNRIIDNSVRILDQAIINGGSTVRSFQSSIDHTGSNQKFLKVYSKEGTLCERCKKRTISKIFLKGRGTTFCSNCQKVGLNVAITGKIASGKSLVTSYFKECGFKTFSADEQVKELYCDKQFLSKLKKEFPFIFTPELNKEVIKRLLFEDARFKKKYESYIYKEVRDKIFAFIKENDGFDKAFEIPLLFDTNWHDIFDYSIGVETDKQINYLKNRNEDVSRKDFNKLNSYDKNKHKLDHIIVNNSSKRVLKEKVVSLIDEIRKES